MVLFSYEAFIKISERILASPFGDSVVPDIASTSQYQYVLLSGLFSIFADKEPRPKASLICRKKRDK